jgi:hypothetical protein
MQNPMPPMPPGVVDPNYMVHQFVPLIAFVVVVVVGAAALRWVFRTPVGEALAERIRQRSHRRWGVTGEDPQRMAALEEHVAPLQGQVAELMLAERRERKLGAGQ